MIEDCRHAVGLQSKRKGLVRCVLLFENDLGEGISQTPLVIDDSFGGGELSVEWRE